MLKKLSNYIEVIPHNNGYVLFNKINGSIVFFNREYIFRKENEFTVLCSEEEENILENSAFFIDELKVRNFIREKCSRQHLMKKTSIILSVTEKCNLSCKYCYQSKWSKDDSLTDEAFISVIMEYFKEIIPQIDNIGGVLNIYFIGGEPLLKSDLILKITHTILAYSNYKGYIHLKTNFYIDTNGLLLSRDFIKKFPNLSVSTTLSLADDHNKLRSNSFEPLYNILNDLKDIFDGNIYRLNIRYNIHHKNYHELNDLVEKLNDTGIKYSLDIQNIMNVPSATFVNKLNNADFEKIYLEKIVPLVLKRGIIPNILPEFGLSRHCLNANILNRKYYSNGQIVVCDAIPKSNRNQPLGELISLPEMCINCYDFPYCGGPKPCDTYKCTGIFRNKQNVRDRIILYVKQSGILEDS